MPNYFRNLNRTIASIEAEKLTPFGRFSAWLSDHLRVVWKLVFLLLGVLFSLWVSLRVGQRTGDDTLLEIAIPAVKDATPERIIESAVPGARRE